MNIESPLSLGGYGYPQPDLALARRSGARSGAPAPEEALVEVADASLAYDRGRKLPLYAEAGLPEAWLVDLKADAIEVHSEPGSGIYAKTTRAKRGQPLLPPEESRGSTPES